MKNFYLYLSFIFLAFLIPLKTSATHYMGGEITWECLSNGNYRFILRAYRECYTSTGAAAVYGNTQTLNSNSPAGSITLTLLQGYPKDISPECNADTNFSHITCLGMSNATANLGAVQEYVFSSDILKPNGIPLQGVPPAAGWIFYWGSCCRNPSTNVQNANTKSWRLRAAMYPYKNQNAGPCFDNSPVFADKPRTVVATGSAFSFNNLAFDKELDSLAYEWGQPLQSSGIPLSPYATGYSFSNPLPDTIQNPNNIGATIDPVTGMVSILSYTSGTYVTSVKVTSYRDGIKISEIWRDIQVVLTTGGTNSPPSITPPFGSGTQWEKTVYAGDTVSINILAADFQFLPNGSPQTISLDYFGQQFGDYVSGFPNTLSEITGCLKPPCATLTPAPGPNTPLQSTFGVQTTFRWVTDCGHLDPVDSLGTNSYTYRFLIKAKDDFCPVPGFSNKIITITVKDRPALPPPAADSIYFDYNGMNVVLNWDTIGDSHNSFGGYFIYYSPTQNGAYALVDSVMNINATSYTYHTGQVNEAYFQVKTKYQTICKSEFSQPTSFQLNITGIENIVKTDGFYLFQNKPNPASGKTTIEFLSEKPVKAEFVITSLQGRIIEVRNIQANTGINRIDIDLNKLPAGVYYYSVIVNGVKKSKKMIVIKNISE